MIDFVSYVLLVMAAAISVLLIASLYNVMKYVDRLSEPKLTTLFLFFAVAIFLTLLWTIFDAILLYLALIPPAGAYIPSMGVITALSVIYYSISFRLRDIAHTFGHG